MKFNIGDRVSINEENAHFYRSRDGVVLKVRHFYDGGGSIYMPEFEMITYTVLLDGFNRPCQMPDSHLTFPREYDEFLAKIEDRLL